MPATVPQRISTAKIQISQCDANVCFLHNYPAFLFLSVIVEVLSLYFLLRLFPTSLKTFAPKNQLYFPYSLFPFLGVPFPFSLVLPIFLHHKKPAYNVLQYLVLFTATFFNNIILFFVCSNISLSFLALSTRQCVPKVCFPCSFHTLALQCFISCCFSNHYLQADEFQMFVYLTLIHLSCAPKLSVQLQQQISIWKYTYVSQSILTFSLKYILF